MSFLSVEFACFFCLVLAGLAILKNDRPKRVLLLAASYLFYAYFDYRFPVLLLVQTVAVYAAARLVDGAQEKRRKKRFMLLGAGVALGVLGVLKYCNFFIESFCAAAGLQSPGTLSLILPVGLSFYTFQALSYLFDVYYGRLAVRKNAVDVALYVGFFPQITSGPIVRAGKFFPQLENIKITREQIVTGMQIFLMGAIKKAVIADRLSVCVDAVFEAPGAYSAASLIMAVLSYSIQIYCDFSGYSDMAIGVAKCMGFDLGRNFNVPYLASNPSDFWRRWHISLSTWFRDYVYIPLGGNRKGFARTCLNLFLTMLLSGLWHGASWTFVFWGVLHGAGSAIHKIFSDIRKKHGLGFKKPAAAGAAKAVSVLAMFVFASLCWVFFRADSFGTAYLVLSRIFTGAGGINYIYTWSLAYIPLVLGAHAWVLARCGGQGEYIRLPMSKFSSQLIFWIILMFALMLFYSGNTAFIYAQF